jgi:hypothetical protein
MQSLFIILGIAPVLVGVLWPLVGKLPVGRLPGDIVIERPGFKLYLPLVTSLLVSVVLSPILWLFRR